MNDFGSTKEVESLIHSRRRTDLIWKVVFIIGTCMAILFLVLLLSSIINSVFGYAALRYSVDPVELVYGKESVKDFTREELIDSMNSHLSSGIMRRVLSEKSLEEHSNKELVSIIEEFIVEPKVLRTWTLTESLFSRSAIEEFVQKEEGAYLSFRSWLSPQFLVTEQSSDPYKAGIRTAILGSLWIMLITFGFAFPIGVAAAIYLQEYAVDNRLNRILQLNIFNLSAVRRSSMVSLALRSLSVPWNR